MVAIALSLAPREALESAIATMIHQLKAVIGFKEEEVQEMPQILGGDTRSAMRDDKSQPMDSEMLKTRITELSLPQRVELALDNASIRTVGGLVRKREDDLLAIEGLGQKGLQDIKRSLSNLGLTLRSQPHPEPPEAPAHRALALFGALARPSRGDYHHSCQGKRATSVCREARVDQQAEFASLPPQSRRASRRRTRDGEEAP